MGDKIVTTETKNDEKEYDSNEWNKMLHFKDYRNNKYDELRQDCIDNGIKSTMSEFDFYVILSNLDAGSNFDAFSSYTNGVYLTNILLSSHNLNKTFQNDMQEIFDQITDSTCYFQHGTVKTRDRCLIKSQTDYKSARFPNVAKILDFLRCSITFDNSKELYNALEKFINLVNNGKCKCVKEILRIKNGFKSVLDWKSFEDCHYTDVK